MEKPPGNIGPKRYDVDPDTGEHFRTDQELRFDQAYKRFLTMLEKSGAARNYTFSESFLAFNLDLEDDEVAEFMLNNAPGVELKDDQFVVTDLPLLEAHLKAKSSKIPHEEHEDPGDRDEL